MSCLYAAVRAGAAKPANRRFFHPSITRHHALRKVSSFQAPVMLPVWRLPRSCPTLRVLDEITQSSHHHHRHHPAFSPIPKRSAYYSQFCLRRTLRSAGPRASVQRLAQPYEHPSPHFRVVPLCSAAVILSSYFLAADDFAGLPFGERILHHSARL